MKRISFSIFFAFLISLLIHILLYLSIDRGIKPNKLKINTSDKITKDKKLGFTSLRYVRLKKQEKLTKPKKIKELINTKQKIKKSPKNIVKKKKRKIIKNNNIKNKVKTLNLPTNSKQIDLKQLFIKKKKDIKSEDFEEYQESLSKKENEKQQLRNLDKLTQNYIRLYGDQYFSFSKEQKSYIKQNINLIGKITQRYLMYPTISVRTRQSGINVVEFILHPNGDISNLRLIDSSNYTMLDRNSIETIEIAYKDYPKPSQPTKIRIFVQYILR